MTREDDAFALCVFFLKALKDTSLMFWIESDPSHDQHTVNVKEGHNIVSVRCLGQFFQIFVSRAPSLTAAMPLHERVWQALSKACSPRAIFADRHIHNLELEFGE